jgi:hypothetical protein
MRGKTVKTTMGESEKLVLPVVTEALNKMFGATTLHPNGDISVVISRIEYGVKSTPGQDKLFGRVIIDKGFEYTLDMAFNSISREIVNVFSKNQFKDARNG